MRLATALIVFVASLAIAAPAEVKRDASPQSGHPPPPAVPAEFKREASPIVRGKGPKREALPQSGYPPPPVAPADVKREASENHVRPVCPNYPRC